jgi:hypothetical protein
MELDELTHTRCGGCGEEFSGGNAESALRIHIKDGMENKSIVSNSDWHYPSSLTSKSEPGERKLNNGESFWRKVPPGDSYTDRQENFVKFREVYQSKKDVFETGSFEDAKKELQMKDSIAEYTYNCGGCGTEYKTRKEAEEHVALSIEKDQAKTQSKDTVKQSQRLGR